MDLTKLIGLAILPAVCAGCATVEMSSSGVMKNGERQVVVRASNYSACWLIPLCSSDLRWNDRFQEVEAGFIPFTSNATVENLYAALKHIAERENCDLADVTVLDDASPDLATAWNILTAGEAQVSATLRPRARK